MFEAVKKLITQESANVFGICALILFAFWHWGSNDDPELIPLLLKCVTALGVAFIVGEKALGIVKWIWKENNKKQPHPG